MTRQAFTPQSDLKPSETTRIEGESDTDIVEATLTLDEDGTLDVVRMMQDNKSLRLPDSAWQGMKGARQAWLEERGALTTLVIEGEDDEGDWKLSLIFHPDQLRKRRLIREHTGKSSVTFYHRDTEKFDQVVAVR